MTDEVVTLANDSTLGALLERVLLGHPDLKPFREEMMCAVNKEYASASRRLADGDEVALFPPVSGGCLIRIQRRDILIDEIVDSLQTAAAGAVVVFLGTVRADPGVTGLQYEAYDGMVESELGKVRREAIDRFSLLDLAIVHRSGLLKVGERVVAVAAVARRRKDAFEGCSWAMDALKRVVPIWKKEVYNP